MLCVLILLAAARQDSLEAQVRSGIQGFASDDLEVRERSGRTLKALGPSALPHLDAILKEERDPETHARIKSLVKDLRVARSGVLFGEGRLKVGLAVLAAAEHPADPEGRFKSRMDQARKDLLTEIGADDPPDAIIKRVSPSGAALREKHGVWGLSAVLELLHPKALNRPGEAHGLLKSWSGDPILIPVLTAALKEKDDRFVAGICDVLLIFGRGSPEVRKGLALLESDESRLESLRSLVHDILVELGGKP